MTEFPNGQHPRPDRHRRWRRLWTIALFVAAGAAIIAVVDASNIGALAPIFVAVAIALHSEHRGMACGRRHAK